MKGRSLVVKRAAQRRTYRRCGCTQPVRLLDWPPTDAGRVAREVEFMDVVTSVGAGARRRASRHGLGLNGGLELDIKGVALGAGAWQRG